MIQKLLFIAIVSILLLESCTSESTKDQKAETQEPTAQKELLGEKKNSKNFVMSSPIEMASLLQKTGIKFNQAVLVDPAVAEHFDDSYKKALVLGMYGADLGFVTMYREFELIPNYLEQVSKLATDLKIGHFLDYDVMKRLSLHSNDLDSIMYLTTRNYENIGNYLREKNRNNIRVFILIGGWIESMHIATSVISENQMQEVVAENPQLINRIGVQKILLEEIINELERIKGNEQFKDLVTSFEELNLLYNSVNISYNEAKPEREETEDVITIVDKSSSLIDIQPEVLQKIAEKVSSIRAELLAI